MLIQRKAFIRLMLSATLISGWNALAQNYTVTTIAGGAGTPLSAAAGDGGSAASATLGRVTDVAIDASGNTYIATPTSIRKVAPNGTITTVAGGGASVQDLVPALQAAISPSAIVATANGTLYIADVAFGVSRIRRIDSTGIIATVAGGSCCDLGDGGPAVGAYLGMVFGIAIDGGGNLYIGQTAFGNDLVRKVSLSGVITTVAGGGACCALNEGGLATSVALSSPTGLAVDASGNLYIAEYGGNRVREVSGGLIHTIAGTGAPQDFGDGGLASQAGLAHPWHLAVNSVSGGALLVSQLNSAAVRALTADGRISTVAGDGSHGFSGDGGSGTSATLDTPTGIAGAPNGAFYFADTSGGIGRVRSLTPAASSGIMPPVVAAGGVVPVFSSSSIIQSGSWASIYGSNLAAATIVWNGDFPTTLGGTSVSVNGKRAYLWFVSPGQINFQAPDDPTVGMVTVSITTAAGNISTQVMLSAYAPSLSLLNSRYPTAIALTPGSPGNSGGGYDIIGPAGVFSFPTRPAHPGETLVLFGVGFGPTNPPVPAGKLFSGAAASTVLPTVTIGGANAVVTFAGIVQAGLFQINIQVPSVSSGDQPLVATIGGMSTSTFLAVGTP
jgi:uncharacterized protein (TIGR03437 family)